MVNLTAVIYMTSSRVGREHEMKSCESRWAWGTLKQKMFGGAGLGFVRAAEGDTSVWVELMLKESFGMLFSCFLLFG
jgi:hypothetical protein